jgi:uncharacterized protein
MKAKLDEIVFNGHPNVTGLHRNTIEVTKDSEISKKADCIIGVNATKACADLSAALKTWILSSSWLEFEIATGKQSFIFEGRGSSKLDLADSREVVLRRSDYTSSRTAAVCCSQSACDIPRELIATLQNPRAQGRLIIRSSSRPKTDSFVWTLP